MPLVITDAVVLHAFDYLDSSRILRVATQESGVLSVLARGARRPRNKFGSAIDLFVQGIAHVQIRPNRDLQTLVNFDVTRARAVLSFDLDRFAAASAFAELTLRVVQDESHHALFDVVTAALDGIADAPAGQVLASGVGGCWRLIAELGFSPVVDRCCVCHAGVAPDDVLGFSCSGGGVVCERCARTVPLDRKLPASARDALRAWLAGTTPDIATLPERRAHQRLLREFVAHHVADERDLRAFHSWESGALRGA
jgi:DNA repair protein RecO (recombination protein O)